MEALSPGILAQIESLEQQQRVNIMIIMANLFSFKASEIDKERIIRTALSTTSQNTSTVSSNVAIQSSINEAFSLRINGTILTLVGFIEYLHINEKQPATDCVTVQSKESNNLAIILVLLAIVIRFSDLINLNQASREKAEA